MGVFAITVPLSSCHRIGAEESRRANDQKRAGQTERYHKQRNRRGCPEIALRKGEIVRELIRRPGRADGSDTAEGKVGRNDLWLRKDLDVESKGENRQVNHIAPYQGELNIQRGLPGVSAVDGGGFQDIGRDSVQSAIEDRDPASSSDEEAKQGKDQLGDGWVGSPR